MPLHNYCYHHRVGWRSRGFCRGARQRVFLLLTACVWLGKGPKYRTEWTTEVGVEMKTENRKETGKNPWLADIFCLVCLRQVMQSVLGGGWAVKEIQRAAGNGMCWWCWHWMLIVDEGDILCLFESRTRELFIHYQEYKNSCSLYIDS